MTTPTADLAKVAGALAKPVLKLIEVVENGIGALVQPVLTIINAHADGRARLIRAGYAHQLKLLQTNQRLELQQAQKTAEVAPSAPALPGPARSETDSGDRESGDVAEIEVVFEDSLPSELNAAQAYETRQQAKRRANLVVIAAEAADNIGDSVSDEPVDDDWVARFFSYAQDVSNEQLQALWGKVLAGEVGRPGQIPLRTLDLLRNITKGEAELLMKLGARTSAESIYFPYGQLKLSGRDQLLAQDAGFLQHDERRLHWVEDATPEKPPTRRLPSLPPGKRDVRYTSGHVLSISTESMMFTVATYIVRPSVLPILNIIKPGVDSDYIRGVAEALNAESYFRATVAEPTEAAG